MGIETAIAIAGVVAAAATAGTTVYAATQKPPKAPAPPKLVEPTPEINKGAAQAEENTRRQAAVARGRNSTILTDPLGEATTQVGAATLLGS